MATIDLTGTGPTDGKLPVSGVGKNIVFKATHDLTAGAITQANIYQVLAIPANVLVKAVKILWVTPAVGTTLTIDVGDGAGSNSWDASVDGKTTAGAWTHSAVGTDAYAAAAARGKFYSSADSIDMVMTTATSITAGPKFTIFAECVDYN